MEVGRKEWIEIQPDSYCIGLLIVVGSVREVRIQAKRLKVTKSMVAARLKMMVPIRVTCTSNSIVQVGTVCT